MNWPSGSEILQTDARGQTSRTASTYDCSQTSLIKGDGVLRQGLQLVKGPATCRPQCGTCATPAIPPTNTPGRALYSEGSPQENPMWGSSKIVRQTVEGERRIWARLRERNRGRRMREGWVQLGLAVVALTFRSVTLKFLSPEVSPDAERCHNGHFCISVLLCLSTSAAVAGKWSFISPRPTTIPRSENVCTSNPSSLLISLPISQSLSQFPYISPSSDLPFPVCSAQPPPLGRPPATAAVVEHNFHGTTSAAVMDHCGGQSGAINALEAF